MLRNVWYYVRMEASWHTTHLDPISPTFGVKVISRWPCALKNENMVKRKQWCRYYPVLLVSNIFFSTRKDLNVSIFLHLDSHLVVKCSRNINRTFIHAREDPHYSLVTITQLLWLTEETWSCYTFLGTLVIMGLGRVLKISFRLMRAVTE